MKQVLIGTLGLLALAGGSGMAQPAQAQGVSVTTTYRERPAYVERRYVRSPTKQEVMGSSAYRREHPVYMTRNVDQRTGCVSTQTKQWSPSGWVYKNYRRC